MLCEGGLSTLGQKDLGADVAVQGRLPHQGAGQGHLFASRGAAWDHEGLGTGAARHPEARREGRPEIGG